MFVLFFLCSTGISALFNENSTFIKFLKEGLLPKEAKRGQTSLVLPPGPASGMLWHVIEGVTVQRRRNPWEHHSSACGADWLAAVGVSDVLVSCLWMGFLLTHLHWFCLFPGVGHTVSPPIL